MATSPLPLQGPTSGQNCYVTPKFTGVPKQGDKIKSGYLTATFSGAHKWAELLRNLAFLGVPEQGAIIRDGYLTPAFSGATRGRNCYATLHSWGTPKKWNKIKSGYLTPAFSGAHKWVELLRNPCILGGPRTTGQNQKWLPHPCLLRGPQVGGIAT